MGKHKRPGPQDALNRQALKMVSKLPDDDPCAEWIRLKIEHGLAVNRPAEQQLDFFPRILVSRMALRDVSYVGRTDLEIARAHVILGHVDLAEEELEIAQDRLEEVGYSNAIAQVQEELDVLRQRPRPNVFHGVGKGERLADLDLERVCKEAEAKLQHPAYCFVEVGEGQYLVEQIGEGFDTRYRCVLVDQQVAREKSDPEHPGKKINPFNEIRQRVNGVMNTLYAEIDRGAALAKPIPRRAVGLPHAVRREGRSQTNRVRAGYRVHVDAPEIEGQLATNLDKLEQNGYRVFTAADIEKNLHRFDAFSQRVIEESFTT